MVYHRCISLVIAIAVFQSLHKMADTGPLMKCSENYLKKSCYKDSLTSRTLPILLISARHEIEQSWGNWNMFIQSFVCRCAIQARKKGFKYFGIQFYGECWSGNVTADWYSALVKTDKCVDQDLIEPCTQQSKLCVGQGLANFVYELAVAEVPTTKPPASDCTDVLDRCPQYADRGLCIDRYPDVLRYCRFSCGKCKF